jgi:fumarylpyruvate hydrolase
VELAGAVDKAAIRLRVNGEVRQQGHISDLIWQIPELIAELSTYYRLRPGDLIFTGTPAGVAAVKPGDRLEGVVEGLLPIHLQIIKRP